jgi:hypothetical protein
VKKLLECHPQVTKSALAENESVKIEKFVCQSGRKLRTGQRKRKSQDIPWLAGAIDFTSIY